MSRERKRNKPTLHWLFKNAGKNSLGIGMLSLGRAVNAASSLAFALVLKNVIDSAAAGNRETFFFNLLLCVGIFLLQDALCALTYYLEEKTGIALEKCFKEQLYHSILHADYRALGMRHSGDLMNCLNGDVGIIATNMIAIFSGLASMLVSLVGAALILAFWNWKFCTLFLVAGVGVALVTMPIRNIMKNLHKDVRAEYDKVQSFQQETVENMIMVRSFFSEKTAEKVLDSRLNLLKRVRMRRNHVTNISYTGFYVAMDFGYILGLFWYGLGVINGQATLGTLTAVLKLVGQVQQPFADIGSFLPKYYALCASAERLRELEDLPKEEISQPLSGGKDYYKELARIEIRDLSFSYGRNQVLSGADLIIEKGDFIAFTGASGAGKSTLIKLLLALYKPVSGSIRLCGTDGEILPVTPSARVLFAYVPQSNDIMSGNIYEAVNFLHETDGFSEDEKKRIRRACEIACADSFIQEMPNGYETVIGERGAGLSQGQKQRLAIARAIYSDAPILLLDESTSALDESTEEQVLKNIRSMSDKTVLIVTHRKKALSICNRIVRISKKQFVEGN